MDAQIHTSIKARRSTENLKRYVFGIMKQALSEHYGLNYSDKCLQSSLGIRHLLKRLNINSVLVYGEVCVPAIGKGNPFSITWQGFWGEHHHLWILSEFHELIDFTIAQINDHPATIDHYRVSQPPVWWTDIELWPYFIKYLPKPARVNVELPPLDQKDLDQFLALVSKLDEDFRNNSPGILYLDPILTDFETMDFLARERNEWIEKCSIMVQQKIALPDYILEKHMELLKPYVG